MKSLQGHLLVASPKLADGNFFRSVILMIRHGEEGALGVIVNRPLETTIQMVWEQVSESPCLGDGPLFRGGPCEGPLMVLHDDASLSEVEVIPGVHFTTDKEAIEQLVAVPGRRVKFFVGYAGWSVGQLEDEIREGSWQTTPAAAVDVFGNDNEDADSAPDPWERLSRKIHLTTAFPWLDPRRVPTDPTVN